MTQANSITYVSNAGVLVNINEKKILIDGLCNSKLPIYKNPPPKISEKIIRGIPPFDNIDIMLITHYHSDHFDPNSTGEFLKQNPNTIAISTSEVILKIKSHLSYTKATNLIELKPVLHSGENITVNGVSIQAISMIHDGKQYQNIQHYAYLIENGIKILHIGDARPVKENYEALNLKQKRIDLLIATFPYIGLPAARQIIKEYIDPQKIVIVHLPYKELDSFGWIEATKKSYEHVKNDFIKTEFLEEPGYSLMV